MPEFVERVFKRKGIAWRKSGLYVHPPEADQWDNFLPKDSNPSNDNNMNNKDEATFEIPTVLPVSAQEVSTTTETGTKSSLLSSLAKRAAGTIVLEVQKSRKRRRQSGKIASASERIASGESASSCSQLPEPPTLPQQHEDEEEAESFVEMKNMKQNKDNCRMLSHQSAHTASDQLTSSGDNSQSDIHSQPLTPHGNRTFATHSSSIELPQVHDTPSPQEENHAEEEKEKIDGCKPEASNDFGDDNSPVGVDQLMHRPKDSILSPQEGVITGCSDGHSAHQPRSESTTPLLKEQHRLHDTVGENQLCPEQGVEISSESELPCNDVYDVVRRLERKTKRQRTIPKSTCDLKRCRDKASDLSTLEGGSGSLSSQPTTVPNIEVKLSHSMHQPNARPPSHHDTSRGKITIVHSLKSTSFHEAFQVALQDQGFLDQYIFIERYEHLSNILVRDESNSTVPLGTRCGDDRYWRIVSPMSLEYSLSDTLETNQLRWESALLQFLELRQDEIRFPQPVDVCLHRNKVALTLKLKTESLVLGTLMQVITLHSTFGMGTIPEPIIGWLVLEMIKIMASLHRIGIAHNNLGLESFLVVFDGAEWTLLLIGLGMKSSVQVGDDLKSHFHHDMLSVAFITWSLLMGCAPFQFNHLNGEIKVEGLQNIAMNMYLRGRLEWKELFTALANSAVGSQGIGSVPETTVSGDAIAGFFDSLLALGPDLLSDSAYSTVQFPTTLGISSEELVFKLHFGQTVSYAQIDNPKALLEVSNESQSNDVSVNQHSTVQGTLSAKHTPFNIPSNSNDRRKMKWKSNVKCPSSLVEHGAPPTDPSASSKVLLGSKDRVVTFVPARPRFDSSRSSRRLMKESLKTKNCRRSSRTVPMCGMNGCKNQFPVNNGYMWVMMVGLEEQAKYKSESVIPIRDPMHLVCLKCREPNADLMFPAQELFDDPREQRRWEKYLYYKASKVEYDRMVGKEKKA